MEFVESLYFNLFNLIYHFFYYFFFNVASVTFHQGIAGSIIQDGRRLRSGRQAICIIYIIISLRKCMVYLRFILLRNRTIRTIYITSKRLPLQPVSSERNHQVADKFRKMCCLNAYGRKRGRMGVKQCMHSSHSLDCLLGVFFDDYMSKLFPIFYLANFVCFHPSKYKAFLPNINYIFLILPYTK